jgi:hypothetical protein
MEVNDLKHKPAGKWVGRAVTFDQALTAVSAVIEILLEWDRTHPAPC